MNKYWILKLFRSEFYWKKFDCFSAAIWQAKKVIYFKGTFN